MTDGGDAAPTLRERAAARNPLPEGTFAVGIGLLVSGVAAYGFLAIAARTLGEEPYAPLGVLWTIVFLIGPGFFLPIEQEVSRALADRIARGVGSGTLIRRAATLAGALLAVLLVATAVASPALLEHFFDDQVLLVVGFALALAGAATGHLLRGTCSGQGRFRPYAVFLGGEAVVRVLLCIVLAIVGAETAGPFGLAIGVAPLLAAAIAFGRERGLVTPGPEARFSELSPALAALLVGSILSFTLVNGGPVVVELLGTDADAAEAGRFLNGLIVARVPLFLFQAVQASLLPRLSALAGAGQFDEFRVGLRRLLVVTAGIGVLATGGAFAIGPFVVRTVFGPEFDLDHRTLGLLALSCAAYMVALALGQAVIALSGHTRVAASWAAGVAAFVAGVAVLSDDLFLRVELGLVAGSVVAAVCMAASLRARLAAGAQPYRGALIEALHDLPLEP